MQEIRFDVHPHYAPSVEGSGWGGASLPGAKITADFFSRSAAEVARDLIGKKLVSSIGGVETAGIIVETQAYTGADDPATHLYRGESSKTAEWKPGSLYVYSVQGHAMLTFATPPYDQGATVLVRALEPTTGVEEMLARVGGKGKEKVVTQGPGRLAKALGITDQLNGTNIFDNNRITIGPGFPLDPSAVLARPRVNSNEPSMLFRYLLAGNRWVSAPRR